jgi:phosphoribosylformylglycinamidine (FGAM) synthase-like enzyme
MEENISALYSAYIIDGVRESLTPARILQSVSAFRADNLPEADSFAPIVDETPDVTPSTDVPDSRKVEKYLSAVLRTQRVFPMAFASQYTRMAVAKALTDTIWKIGHFRIGDLAITMKWLWNDAELGNMAGFYRSVEAVGDMLDALNLHLLDYSYETVEGPCSLVITTDLRPSSDDDQLVEQPYTTADPSIGVAGISNSLQPDEASWIVYIPFDSPSSKLGGSLLSQALNINPPLAPQADDTDYFIDCFEVVRELVEDGIVLAGASVGEGGLLPALKGMATSRTGALLDLSDLKRASAGSDMVGLLFAEVPGVIIQIRDIDFDYMDAELLLQDVAFYPLGHPAANGGTVRVKASAKTGIQNILESLVQRQGGEGED